MNPADPDRLHTRDETVEKLAEVGFPISKATLATMATRGGGPPFQRFGRRPLYRWSSTLDWARARLSPSITSTSEINVMPSK